jgi:hypothetical protein
VTRNLDDQAKEEPMSDWQGNSVSIARLRRTVDRILDTIEEKYGQEVTLMADEYWQVSVRQAYDLAPHPEQWIECGTVSDDVAEVLSDEYSRESVTAIWHDMNHLVGILGALAALDLPPLS